MKKVEVSKESVKAELSLLKSQGEAPEWLTWMSYAMLRESYLLPNQTPKQRFRLIADSAAKYMPSEKKEWSDKFFDLMYNNFLAPSTPVMGNLGTERGLAVSCSSSYVGDTTWDILYSDYEIGMLSKHGFGTSAYFDIRPGFSPISGGGYTNSVIDWIEKYWRTQNTVSQGSLRRGSTAIYVNFWHGELLKVLPMLETHDKLHLGVVCDDSVKKALSENDEDAWVRYKAIITWRARKGKPYIILIDNAKRQDPPQYKDLGLSTKQSNLCLSGDTKVLTKEFGAISIQELVGKTATIYDGSKWVSNSNFRKTQDSAELYRVHLSDGSYVDATDSHRWFTTPETVKMSQAKGFTETRTSELVKGMKLEYHNQTIEGFNDTTGAYAKGFLLAEGTRVQVSPSKQEYKPLLWVYEPKKMVYERLKASLEEIEITKGLRVDSKTEIQLDKSGEGRYRVSGLGSRRSLIDWAWDFKKNLPEEVFTWSIKSRTNFIAGLFDGDGTYMKTNGGYQLASIHKGFLEQIQILLKGLGIRSNLSMMREGGKTDFNDGYGEYNTQAAYRITVSSYWAYELSKKIKFERLPQYDKPIPNRFCADFTRVTKIEKLEGTKEVYCTTVPSSGKFALANGVITGNCTEIFQHTDSDYTLACVLSSMVLNRFDEWYGTDAVFNSIVFLDCINEDLIQRGQNIKGLERVVKSAKASRALGLGALGFHTYLQQKMIPFDSFQATRENAKIFSYINQEAERASRYLATVFGEPEFCKGTGLRNTHTTAIAPNTSSAMIAGAVSQGIEPVIANCYEQKLSKIGSIERVNPTLLTLLRKKGKYNEEVINSIAFNKGSVQHLDFLSDLEKQVFKTAYEINQKVLIDLAEQRQRWISQGQSLNLFFAANEQEEWIHEVHKYAFNKELLKSLYYVRTMAGISADKGDSCLACEG